MTVLVLFAGFPGVTGHGDEDSHAAENGVWTTPFDGEVPAINMALMPDGRVLYYSGIEANETDEATEPTDWVYFTVAPNRSQSRIYDPDTGTVTTPVDHPVVDLFCSGTTVRPDGSVLAVDGTEWETTLTDPALVKGTNQTYAMSPQTDTWTREADLHERRWYPSVIELPDGGALAVSGIKNLTQPNTNTLLLERLDPDGTEWSRLEPTLEVAPGVELGYQGSVGDTELGPATFPIYPRVYVVGGGPLKGEVFYASNGDIWGPFGERPEEPLWGAYQSIDPDTGEVTVVGHSLFGVRHLGASVPLMLDPADGYAPEILTFGGTLEHSARATDTAEIVDLGDPMRPAGETTQPVFEPEPVENMTHARWQNNGVLLPTGKVLSVGGNPLDSTLVYGQHDPTEGHVLAAEQFDPETGTWEELASMEVARGYHSTAVLLPDGRVLTGGHVPLPVPFPQLRKDHTEGTPAHHAGGHHSPANQSQIKEERLEIYEPPYLHNDEDSRPAISAFSPDGADWSNVVDNGEQQSLATGYDDGFLVNVTGLDEGLDEVVLVRPGATTHAYDADQRGVILEGNVVSQHDGVTTLELETPPDGAIAPPGHYMLFVNEDLGDEVYPSEAMFLELG